MTIGVVVLAVGVVAAFLVARRGRLAVGVSGDWSEAIVDLSARRLVSTRPDWGRAMVAELACLQGRATRLRFALGCVRAALVAPLADPRPARAARVVVAAAAVAVIGLGGWAQQRAAVAPAVGQHGVAYELAATALGLAAIGVHAWMVDRRARDASTGAASSRRPGVIIGVILGISALVVSLPLPGAVFSSSAAGVVADVGFPLVIGGCLLAGLVAARASGNRASGYQAGVWAARVAGSIMAIGLLAATLWATGWFVHDPATIRTYQDSLSAAHYTSYHTHFRTIAGFVVSENIDTALIGSLVWFPIIGLVFGTLGGALGAGRRPEPA